MSEEKAIAESLKELGDPSGRQDQQYWNDWFQSVCCNRDHRPFEWYTSADHVVRVVAHHLEAAIQHDSSSDSSTARARQRMMIHPGSGTSLVPLVMSESLPDYRHVVVEVSPVAIQEMKEFHEKAYLARNPLLKSSPVEYILADLLQPSSPLDLESSSFDAWIDKGFVDAVFSEKDQQQNQQQSTHLFKEAHRLLVEQGIVLVVTLAEQHSLELLLDNWNAVDLDGSNLWSDLHVWEMEPVSGEMLPFGIVMVKSPMAIIGVKKRCLVLHSFDGTESQSEIGLDTPFDFIHEHVSRARAAFAKRVHLEKQRYIVSMLEIKPYAAETDLVTLGDRIRSMDWHVDGVNGRQSVKPVWQAFSADGVETQQIVPIGFGISKLRLKCIIHADEIDHLVSAIEDWEGDDIIDGVQSVDIDWDATVAIADIPTLRRNKAT